MMTIDKDMRRRRRGIDEGDRRLPIVRRQREVSRDYFFTSGGTQLNGYHCDFFHSYGLFPGCLLQSTAIEDSDHCPLILGLKATQQGKLRFHFESFWPKFEGFHEAV